MFIGKVSELTGASRKAIRHYEEMGLIRIPKRQGTYRVYDKNHVHLISSIKRAQSLGFKLSELVPLYKKKYQKDQFPVDIAMEIIDRKMTELKKQISQAMERERKLQKLKDELNEIRC